MSENMLIILGMSLITIIIRCFPLFLPKINFKNSGKQYLNTIPLAVLTSLIFPEVFGVSEKYHLIFLMMGLPVVFVYWKLPVYLNLIISFIVIVLLNF